jgi:hypothetical protein
MLINIVKTVGTASALVNEGEGRSMPIPAGRSSPIVKFLVYPQHLNADHIGEPIGLIEVKLPDNQVRRVDAPRWREHGISAPKNHFRVGQKTLREGVDRSVWLAKYETFCASMNVALPIFHNNQIHTKQSRSACQFVAKNYFDLGERGLDSYYNAVSPEWFAWLSLFRGDVL